MPSCPHEAGWTPFQTESPFKIVEVAGIEPTILVGNTTRCSLGQWGGPIIYEYFKELERERLYTIPGSKGLYLKNKLASSNFLGWKAAEL